MTLYVKLEQQDSFLDDNINFVREIIYELFSETSHEQYLQTFCILDTFRVVFYSRDLFSR
jgi:hypothetical protein